MPRKSAAALAIAPFEVATPSYRLAPPCYLSEVEKSIWLQMVNDQPATAFSAVHVPLMEAYVRHVVRGRILAQEIDNFDRSWLVEDEGLRRYDRLLAMAEREARSASSLATRLRITRQAMEHPETNANANLRNKAQKKTPWQLAHEKAQRKS